MVMFDAAVEILGCWSGYPMVLHVEILGCCK